MMKAQKTAGIVLQRRYCFMFAPSYVRAAAPRAALALALLAAPCFARAEGEAIHLLRRGKTGDQYKYQVIVHSKGELDLSSSPDPVLQDVTRTKLILQKRLGSDPKSGDILIETRLLSGKKTDVQPDKTVTTENLAPFDVTFRVSPDRVSFSGKALPLPVTQGKTKPLSAAAINAALLDATEFFMDAPLPTRLLRVGDTWAGVNPKNSHNSAIAEDKDVPFTATLAAIETHRGVPCAKVTYVMTYKGDVASFRAKILKTAPEESDMIGESEINGVATAYYSLDRGEIMDRDITLKTKHKYKVGVKIEGQQYPLIIDVEGEGATETHTTAMTFPPYDATLRGK